MVPLNKIPSISVCARLSCRWLASKLVRTNPGGQVAPLPRRGSNFGRDRAEDERGAICVGGIMGRQEYDQNCIEYS